MKRMFQGLIAASVLAAAGITVHGSSHREALAILNEPCADNTDTYAWVSNSTHDKLYLIMDFNPLHEPGQGNQGLRACNGYRYEFHIAKGTSLAGRRGLPRRVQEHAQARSRSEPDRSSRRRQRTALAADRRHRDHEGHAHQPDRRLAATIATTRAARRSAGICTVLPNNHGPQTDRLIYGLGPFKGYDSGDPTQP